MKKTKLILIEGLPGSGKSLFGQFLGLQLNRNNINAEWYNECELNHPVQFEYEAGFSEKKFYELLEQHKDYSQLLTDSVINRKNIWFLNYVDMKRKYESINNELIDIISKKDVFEGDAETYKALGLEKWELFAEELQNSDRVVVLESSIFQVQINALRDKTDFEDIKKFINNIVKIIMPCDPVLIYFYQNSTEHALERAIMVKGERWFNNVYGGQSFSKTVSRLNQRKELEYGIFKELAINKLIIENSESNWSEYESLILEFIGISYIPDSEIKGPEIKEFTGIYESEVPTGNYTNKFDLVIERGRLFDRKSRKVLVRKDEMSFFKQGLPTELKFQCENGKIKGFTIVGTSVPEESIPGPHLYKKI